MKLFRKDPKKLEKQARRNRALALISPYLVRVISNKIWKYVIPIYAIVLGVITIIFI